MHKIITEALPNAHGRSERIIVVIADIRGFSAFCLRHESSDVAMYIKRVYVKLINQYFPFHSFYKPTGDGLLITIQIDEENLEERAQTTVDACLQCLEEFPDICAGDAMINFEVPSQIGFGLTRGTACCLISGDAVLDYSGQILNLASRLTDYARPKGIVLDGQFGIELLSNPVKEKFEPTKVFIRSVAEAEPRGIYVPKGVVEVPAYARMPIDFERWDTLTVDATLAEWRVRGPKWSIDLPKRLKRPDGFRVEVESPHYKSGKRVPDAVSINRLTNVHYALIGGQPLVLIDTAEMVETSRTGRTPLKSTARLIVHFVPQVQ